MLRIANQDGDWCVLYNSELVYTFVGVCVLEPVKGGISHTAQGYIWRKECVLMCRCGAVAYQLKQHLCLISTLRVVCHFVCMCGMCVCLCVCTCRYNVLIFLKIQTEWLLASCNTAWEITGYVSLQREEAVLLLCCCFKLSELIGPKKILR